MPQPITLGCVGVIISTGLPCINVHSRQVFTLFICHADPQGEQRYSSTLFQDLRHQMGVGGSSPRPGHLYPRERPGTHCTGGWVGLRASPDGRKTSSPPGFDPGPSSPQSVTIPTELPGPLTYRVRTSKFDLRRTFRNVTVALVAECLQWSVLSGIKRPSVQPINGVTLSLGDSDLRTRQLQNLFTY